jgi:hypothetical protein
MNYKYALIGDSLCLLGSYRGEPPFAFFPQITEDSELDFCVNEIQNQCDTCAFRPLTSEMAERMKRIFPDSVITPRRDLFDYVYSTEQLINLTGRRFHAKRNHINTFISLYNNYKYTSIGPHNITLLREAVDSLFTERDNEDLTDEYGAICIAVDAFEELGLSAGVITVDGKIAAYSIGEKMNCDTALIHTEKADRSYNGAYAIINRDFLRAEFSDTLYVNREEDMGIKGLRKAKLSYNPIYFNEVYSLTLPQ